MRPFTFILLTALLGLYACGSNGTSGATPQTTATTAQSTAVQDNFKLRFPTASEVEWDTVEDGYVASFVNNDTQCEVFYDNKNAFQYAGVFVDQTDLPAAAQDFLTKNYKQDFVNACMQVDFPNKKGYNVEVMTDTDYVNMEFDLKGNLVQQSKEPLTDEEMQAREEEGVDDSAPAATTGK